MRGFSRGFAGCVIALAVVSLVWMGCSSEDKATVEDAAKTATETVDKAKELAKTLSNPKEGVDPVCSMAIDESAVVVTVAGKSYGFCSADCGEKFKENPAKYLTAVDPHEGHDH